MTDEVVAVLLGKLGWESKDRVLQLTAADEPLREEAIALRAFAMGCMMMAQFCGQKVANPAQLYRSALILSDKTGMKWKDSLPEVLDAGGIAFDEAQRMALVSLLGYYLQAGSRLMEGKELPMEFTIIVKDRTVDVFELLAVAMLDTHFGAGTCAKAAEEVKEKVKCDGNHGGHPCDDPECWLRDPTGIRAND